MHITQHPKPIIVVNNLSTSFGQTIVHKSISFEIYQGEIVTILGPSGTGKTVLLKTLIGLIHPKSGEINVLGINPAKATPETLLALRKKVGMLFQGAALFDSLTVFENIVYGLREQGETNENTLQKIAGEKLKWVGLEEFQNKYPANLSGGQKKRVGLARALATSPQIILFDEPTTGLDPTTVRLIDNLILRLKNELNITSIVVTHDIQSATRISDRWLLLNNGTITANGPVPQLINSNTEIQNFINGTYFSF
ncbi:MAG TPA: ATP-binding cassette domain-containing protein [Oligoflexia bacterium]|nr:ATP-binding cassette domain-containing protein [Oligoflexia bacterium]HMP26545.1 ATP-binding cassette domain-containing protein [Oligoflexia bacterium]